MPENESADALPDNNRQSQHDDIAEEDRAEWVAHRMLGTIGSFRAKLPYPLPFRQKPAANRLMPVAEHVSSERAAWRDPGKRGEYGMPGTKRRLAWLVFTIIMIANFALLFALD